MTSDDFERYMELIKSFPLVVIKDQERCKQAKAIIKRLTQQEESDRLTVDEAQYLQVLQRLVSDYEEPKKMTFMEQSPHDALGRLMREHNVSQAELIEISGEYKTNVSAFLSGKRNISRSVAERLAERFNVSPELFSPKHEMGEWVTIYCDGGIFHGLFAVKIVIDKLNAKLKTGRYELEPYSYKAPAPPYYPVYVWLPASKPGINNIESLKREIDKSYKEITRYAYAYHPNNLEERLEQRAKLIERLDGLNSP